MRTLLLLFLFVSAGFSGLASTEGEQLPPIDFSYAGYEGGGVVLPEIGAVLRLRPTGGDDTRYIQEAIDRVAALPLQDNGYRGAILFDPAVFRVAGSLHIAADGIVLRGTFTATDSTVIRAEGTDRRSLFTIGEKSPETGTKISLREDIPAGATAFRLQQASLLQAGERVMVVRHCSPAWIASLGMDTISGVFPERLRWSPGSRQLYWNRFVMRLNPLTNEVVLDAPLTTAIEQRYGGGYICGANDPVTHVGIENMILRSAYEQGNEADEEHAWYGVTTGYVEDAFFRRVLTDHFAGSSFHIGPYSRQITIEDCAHRRPVSEKGGYRRLSYWIEGQQVLVMRCRSWEGVNDFASGFCAGGPNVFLDCEARRALGNSGAYESWASGVLYESVKVDSAGLFLGYDPRRTQAAGWTAANAVLWNCEARTQQAGGPAEAPNYVVRNARPLYRRLLEARKGRKALKALQAQTKKQAEERAEYFAWSPAEATLAAEEHLPVLAVVNGRFTFDGRLVWGGAVNDAWWQGRSNPAEALDAGLSVTRYMPGREGPGLTEDPEDLVRRIKQQGCVFYQSGPGLWYDRRRDEHSVTERMDGDVWAPFYEMPWARTGKGKAWDGLSRFDMTRLNPWYFNRIEEFARLCRREGIVLYHYFYNMHNLLEIGAHWCDYPGREVNNVNTTGLPEPMPLEPRDRLHLGNEFFDVGNKPLLALHRRYITAVLDRLAANENIIFGLAFQNSAPLSFQRFFHQVVADWEEQHHRQVKLILHTSKEAIDSLMAVPRFARQVVAIDMRYWQYNPDGSMWAPRAGINRAYREQTKGKDYPAPTTPLLAYRQVREYHARYPHVALIAWHNDGRQLPALMGGAAQVLMRNPTAGHDQGRTFDATPLDAFIRKYLSEVLMQLEPDDNLCKDTTSDFAMSSPDKSTLLIYTQQGRSVALQQALTSDEIHMVWYNPQSHKIFACVQQISACQDILKPDEGEWLVYITLPSSRPQPSGDSVTFCQRLQPCGRILETPDYYVWCVAPIYAEDGRVHVFYSRWPAKYGMGGWIHKSEIAHAVADRPEGPYRYVETVLAPRPGYWDATTCHNPHIQHIDGKYYLFYMGNSNGKTNTKRIGVAVASSLDGPWTRPDKPLLEAGPDGAWDDHCTTNPAFIRRPDGACWLYYKSWNNVDYQQAVNGIKGNRKYGLAIADRPEGPYTRYEGNPLIDFSGYGNNRQVEDAFVWIEDGTYHMLMRDMGFFNHEVGLYFISDDGLHWGTPRIAWYGADHYVKEPPAPKHLKRYGRFERPQLLMKDGKPQYMFNAMQGGKYQTASGFVFRIEPERR